MFLFYKGTGIFTLLYLFTAVICASKIGTKEQLFKGEKKKLCAYANGVRHLPIFP
jgi:hypothetical protein